MSLLAAVPICGGGDIPSCTDNPHQTILKAQSHFPSDNSEKKEKKKKVLNIPNVLILIRAQTRIIVRT